MALRLTARLVLTLGGLLIAGVEIIHLSVSPNVTVSESSTPSQPYDASQAPTSANLHSTLMTTASTASVAETSTCIVAQCSLPSTEPSSERFVQPTFVPNVLVPGPPSALASELKAKVQETNRPETGIIETLWYELCKVHQNANPFARRLVDLSGMAFFEWFVMRLIQGLYNKVVASRNRDTEPQKDLDDARQADVEHRKEKVSLKKEIIKLNRKVVAYQEKSRREIVRVREAADGDAEHSIAEALGTAKAGSDAQISILQRKHDATVAILEEEYLTSLETLKGKHLASLRALKDKYQANIKARKVEHHASIEALREEHHTNLEASREGHRFSLEVSRTTHNKRLAAHLIKFVASLSTLRANKDAAIAILKARNDYLREARNGLQASVANEKQRIVRLNEQRNLAQNASHTPGEMKEVRQRLVAEQDKVKRLTKTQADYAREMTLRDAVIESSREEFAELNEKYSGEQAKCKQLQDTIDRLNGNVDSLKVRLERFRG